jgi:hypothetical protein
MSMCVCCGGGDDMWVGGGVNLLAWTRQDRIQIQISAKSSYLGMVFRQGAVIGRNGFNSYLLVQSIPGTAYQFKS